MPYVKYKDQGCRAETLFGVWLADEHRIEQLRDTAMAAMERGEFPTLSQRSEALSDVREAAPYVLQDGVARVSVSGVMTKYETSMMSMFGGTSTANLVDTMGKLRRDPAVKGVFVDFDTPGGSSQYLSEAADAIRKTDAVKSVIGHASDECCSGGLWLASQCRRFTCGPTAQVGSLGTRCVLWEKTRSPEDKSPRPIVVSTGKFKAMGVDGSWTEDQIKEWQRIVDTTNESFKNDVIAGRKLSKEQIADVTTARVYVGPEAKAIGLVDDVLSADDAYESAKTLMSTAGSGPGALPQLQKAAPKKGSAMALTEAQLQQARNLPGAAAITVENADVTLLTVAQQLQASAPKPFDPEILQSRFETFSDSLDMRLEKGTITTAQRDLIKSKVQQNGQVVSSMFVGAKGSRPADILLESLDGNRPNGLTTEKAGGQPAPRTEPGATDSAPKLSLERLNRVREANGLGPVAEMPEHLKQ